MYQIRIYYKNDDKNCKKEVVYHLYGSYETYEEARQAMKYLIDCYREMGVKEVVFSYGFPKSEIEAYVLFLSKRGKDFATIVSE